MDRQDRESRDPMDYERDPMDYTDNFQEIPGEPDAPRRMRSRLIVLKMATENQDLRKVSKLIAY